MVVCYDRESCVIYKEALDKLFGGPYATEIVMDTNNDKENRYIAYRRSSDEEQKVLDNYRDARHPMKLLIVTSKLLTGFDAPILQVMYLDKPMKDHTLLQAICRTNRIYGETKTNGLIVDYIGIFDKFARALNFDEESMECIYGDHDQLVPELRRFLEERIEKNIANIQLKESENDKNTWVYRSEYIIYHNIWNGLRIVQAHFEQGKTSIIDPQLLSKLVGAGRVFFPSSYRNCMMHYGLVYGDEACIKEEYYRPDIPLYGLVESCFDGKSAEDYYSGLRRYMDEVEEYLNGWFSFDSSRIQWDL